MRFHYVTQDSLKCLQPLTPEHWNWRQVPPHPASMGFLFQKPTAFSFPQMYTVLPAPFSSASIMNTERTLLSVRPACRGEHLGPFCKTRRPGPSPILWFPAVFWRETDALEAAWCLLPNLSTQRHLKKAGSSHEFSERRVQEAWGHGVGGAPCLCTTLH